MSLDVYLKMRDKNSLSSTPSSSGIFIRENGQTKEITEEEWNIRNPGRIPFRFSLDSDDSSSGEVFSFNITHNLTVMADEAGLYEVLWRPYRLKAEFKSTATLDEYKFETEHTCFAKELIPFLESGLEKLKSDSEYFKGFNPKNGWGNYELLLEFVESYLKACLEYPESEVIVSR